MSPRPVLAGGQALARWLAAGGRPDRAPWTSMLLYQWRAFWFERGLRLLEPAPPTRRQPFPDGEGLLFIMGFWRSGTTLVHELLAEAPGWGAPRAWQCMDPLSPMRGCGAPEGPSLRRPMDAVEIGPRTPQEDEFALLALGVPSLYQGFLDPRRLPSLSPLLDQGFWLGEASGSWTGILARFLDLCREPGCGGLVVKSPNHVFRYRALVRRFPKASFVWILRDPTKLWTSNAGMWKAMTAYYGLWETPPGTLETFLAGALDAFRGLLEELRAEGTLQRDVVLDYGDLVREPGRVLKRLVPLLGLTGDQGADWVRAAVPRVSIQGSSVHSRLPAAGPGLEALRNLQAVIQMETGVG